MGRDHLAGDVKRCRRCHRWARTERHHRVPRSRGGTKVDCVDLCLDCHRGVHDHTVEDWRAWLLRPGEAVENELEF